MNNFAIDAEGSQPVVGEIREQLLEPFIEAASVAFREWANTEIEVRSVYQKARQHTFGDISAILGLMAQTEGSLILSFPEQTADAIAGRILSGFAKTVAEDMVRDCLGELANIIAGQAKALLSGTPYHFVFSTPTVVSGRWP